MHAPLWRRPSLKPQMPRRPVKGALRGPQRNAQHARSADGRVHGGWDTHRSVLSPAEAAHGRPERALRRDGLFPRPGGRCRTRAARGAQGVHVRPPPRLAVPRRIAVDLLHRHRRIDGRASAGLQWLAGASLHRNQAEQRHLAPLARRTCVARCPNVHGAGLSPARADPAQLLVVRLPRLECRYLRELTSLCVTVTRPARGARPRRGPTWRRSGPRRASAQRRARRTRPVACSRAACKIPAHRGWPPRRGAATRRCPTSARASQPRRRARAPRPRAGCSLARRGHRAPPAAQSRRRRARARARAGGDFVPRAVLDGLVVRASSRRAGVGRALVAEAEMLARSWGSGALLLRVEAANRGAREFYTQLGYTPPAGCDERVAGRKLVADRFGAKWAPAEDAPLARAL
mmetsp:Transcript_676/g.2079  ORF Transcript_676/g.2079 Transcript_676/m.2079 type:complete len:404 (-) Transcript_676:874-2085(-)